MILATQQYYDVLADLSRNSGGMVFGKGRPRAAAWLPWPKSFVARRGGTDTCRRKKLDPQELLNPARPWGSLVTLSMTDCIREER
jgi:hypothetical protein